MTVSPKGHRACLSASVVTQPREPLSLTMWPSGIQGSPGKCDLGALCIRYHEKDVGSGWL